MRTVMAADRIHGDDTTVPVLATGKTITGRLWTYVRDDRPFAGPDPPAAVFFYSRDRDGCPYRKLRRGHSYGATRRERVGRRYGRSAEWREDAAHLSQVTDGF